MSFTRKLRMLHFPYHLNNTVFERVPSKTDLGVLFDSTITFNDHIEIVVSKALKTLGFLIRNTKEFKSLETVKKLYFSFLRSHLEYASQVWSPFHIVHIDRLEYVQRRFLKYLYFLKHSNYPIQGYDQDLLREEFQIDSLRKRRTCSGLIFLYKLLNGQIDCSYLLDYLQIIVPRLEARSFPIFSFTVPNAHHLN